MLKYAFLLFVSALLWAQALGQQTISRPAKTYYSTNQKCVVSSSTHISTFDEMHYEFKSASGGDYYLVKTINDVFTVQGAFRPCWYDAQSMCLNGIAFKYGANKLSFYYLPNNNELQMFQNDVLTAFTLGSDMTFNYGTISGTATKTEKTWFVTITATDFVVYLHVGLYCGSALIYNSANVANYKNASMPYVVSGLCGTYDGYATNDFLPRYLSTFVASNDTLQNIYTNFMESWRAPLSEALFTRRFVALDSITPNFDDMRVYDNYYFYCSYLADKLYEDCVNEMNAKSGKSDKSNFQLAQAMEQTAKMLDIYLYTYPSDRIYLSDLQLAKLRGLAMVNQNLFKDVSAADIQSNAFVGTFTVNGARLFKKGTYVFNAFLNNRVCPYRTYVLTADCPNKVNNFRINDKNFGDYSNQELYVDYNENYKRYDTVELTAYFDYTDKKHVIDKISWKFLYASNGETTFPTLFPSATSTWVGFTVSNPGSWIIQVAVYDGCNLLMRNVTVTARCWKPNNAASLSASLFKANYDYNVTASSKWSTFTLTRNYPFTTAISLSNVVLNSNTTGMYYISQVSTTSFNIKALNPDIYNNATAATNVTTNDGSIVADTTTYIYPRYSNDGEKRRTIRTRINYVTTTQLSTRIYRAELWCNVQLSTNTSAATVYTTEYRYSNKPTNWGKCAGMYTFQGLITDGSKCGAVQTVNVEHICEMRPIPVFSCAPLVKYYDYFNKAYPTFVFDISRAWDQVAQMGSLYYYWETWDMKKGTGTSFSVTETLPNSYKLKLYMSNGCSYVVKTIPYTVLCDTFVFSTSSFGTVTYNETAGAFSTPAFNTTVDQVAYQNQYIRYFKFEITKSPAQYGLTEEVPSPTLQAGTATSFSFTPKVCGSYDITATVSNGCYFYNQTVTVNVAQASAITVTTAALGTAYTTTYNTTTLSFPSIVVDGSYTTAPTGTTYMSTFRNKFNCWNCPTGTAVIAGTTLTYTAINATTTNVDYYIYDNCQWTRKQFTMVSSCQTTAAGGDVTFDGATLMYGGYNFMPKTLAWNLVSYPTGSNAYTLFQAAVKNGVNMTFSMDYPGTYVWALTVQECYTNVITKTYTLANPNMNIAVTPATTTLVHDGYRYDTINFKLDAAGSTFDAAIIRARVNYTWTVTTAPSTSIYAPKTTTFYAVGAPVTYTVSTNFDETTEINTTVTSTSVTTTYYNETSYVELGCSSYDEQAVNQNLYPARFTPDVDGTYVITLTAKYQALARTASATVVAVCPPLQTNITSYIYATVALTADQKESKVDLTSYFNTIIYNASMTYEWKNWDSATSITFLNRANPNNAVIATIPYAGTFTFVRVVSNGCASMNEVILVVTATCPQTSISFSQTSTNVTDRVYNMDYYMSDAVDVSKSTMSATGTNGTAYISAAASNTRSTLAVVLLFAVALFFIH